MGERERKNHRKGGGARWVDDIGLDNDEEPLGHCPAKNSLQDCLLR